MEFGLSSNGCHRSRLPVFLKPTAYHYTTPPKPGCVSFFCTVASRPHDARKGRHYYTRSERRLTRSNNDRHTSEASKNVYSSETTCVRHVGGAQSLSVKKSKA